MKTTIIQLQSITFIMPKRLVSLIIKFAQPVGTRFCYVSNTNGESKTVYYKETKQFPKYIEIDDLAENSKQAEEMKIAFENMCKGSMYDTLKKELEEMKQQLSEKDIEISALNNRIVFIDKRPEEK